MNKFWYYWAQEGSSTLHLLSLRFHLSKAPRHSYSYDYCYSYCHLHYCRRLSFPTPWSNCLFSRGGLARSDCVESVGSRRAEICNVELFILQIKLKLTRVFTFFPPELSMILPGATCWTCFCTLVIVLESVWFEFFIRTTVFAFCVSSGTRMNRYTVPAFCGCAAMYSEDILPRRNRVSVTR